MIAKTFALIAGLAVAGAASASTAASARLSDVEFIRANRCQALMQSQSLGAVDASAMADFVKAQSRGRQPTVEEMAAKAFKKASRDANNAIYRDALVAERDGACIALMPANAG